MIHVIKTLVSLICLACLQVLSVLKFEKGNQMPEDYCKSFTEAVAVFQHAQMCVVCANLLPFEENHHQFLIFSCIFANLYWLFSTFISDTYCLVADMQI
jgi:hypothetical protein